MPVNTTRFDDTVVYWGSSAQPAAGLASLKLADRGTAKALLIRADGGTVSVGMDFGD